MSSCELAHAMLIKICKLEKLKILDISNNLNIWLDNIEEFNGIINI